MTTVVSQPRSETTTDALSVRFDDWSDLAKRIGGGCYLEPDGQAFAIAMRAEWALDADDMAGPFELYAELKRQVRSAAVEIDQDAGGHDAEHVLPYADSLAIAEAQAVEQINRRLAEISDEQDAHSNTDDAQPEEITMPVAKPKKKTVTKQVKETSASSENSLTGSVKGKGRAQNTKAEIPTTQLQASIKAALAEGGGTILIPTRFVQPFRHNPRRSFDEAKLQELADSITRLGQKQESLAYVPEDLADGKLVELVAGERRYRACELAKQDLRIRVEPLTEVEAVEVAGVENLDRDDLTPIEEAGWLKSMIDVGGYSQRQLAGLVGLKQPTIALKLGLLKLPTSLQDLVIAGVITQEWCRPLMPYCEGGKQYVSGLLDAAAAEINSRLHDAYQPFDHRVDRNDELLGEAARRIGWACNGLSYYRDHRYAGDRPDEKTARKHADRLDLFEVDGTLYAKNEEAWRELVKPPRGTSNGAAVAKKDNGQLTPKEQAAQERERAKQRKKVLADRMAAEADATYRAYLAAALGRSDDERADIATQVLFTVAVTNSGRLHEVIAEQLKTTAWDFAKKAEAVARWMRAADPHNAHQARLTTVARHLVQVQERAIAQSPVPPSMVRTFADQLAFDWAHAWSLTPEFLQLHTTDQLLDLINEWGIADESIFPTGADGSSRGEYRLGSLKKKAELVEAIATVDRDMRQAGPGLAAPAGLKQAAAKPLRKAKS